MAAGIPPPYITGCRGTFLEYGANLFLLTFLLMVMRFPNRLQQNIAVDACTIYEHTPDWER